MSSEAILSKSDVQADLSLTDVQSDLSLTDVQSVLAITLLSAELVLAYDTLNQWIDNQFTLVDAPSLGFGKNPSDTVTIDEAISSIVFGKGLSDSVSVTESISLLLEILRAFSDAVSFVDTPAATVAPAFSDQQQMLEADAKGVGISKTDTFTFADVETLQVDKGLADTPNLSEVFTRTVTFSRSFSDAFALDDAATINAIRKDTASAKANVFGFSDTETFSVGKVFTDSLSLNEAIDSFDFGKGVTDTVTVSENFSFALFSNAALNAAPLNQSPFNE